MAQGHPWMCSLANVVQAFSDCRAASCPRGFLAVLGSVVACTVSSLVTDTSPWEGGTSGKADYHLPGVAVLLCAQVKPLGLWVRKGFSFWPNTPNHLRYFPSGTWCTLQGYYVLFNEYFPSAEAQSVAKLFCDVIMLFLRHYKGVWWRTPGDTA